MKKPLDLSIYPEIRGDDWRNYIEKELKDLSWQALNWELDDQLIMEAGYHFDDNIPVHYLPNLKEGDWLIGECFEVHDDFGLVRSQLLDALNMGLEAPRISMKDYQQIDTFLEGIFANYLDISWEIEDVGPTDRILKSLKDHSEPESLLNGALLWRAKADGMLVAQFNEISDKLTAHAASQIRCIHLDGEIALSKELPSYELLANILAALNALIERLGEGGVVIQDIIPRIHVSMFCADPIFIEIARIRALRLCFQNLLMAHGVQSSKGIFIDVNTDPNAYGEDANLNRIKGALIGWAAAVGGADRISILGGEGSKNAFDRRIARNIQHLLKMESQIGWVTDPSSGSYYIEAATSKIAELGWARFKELNKTGEYFDGKLLSNL